MSIVKRRVATWWIAAAGSLALGCSNSGNKCCLSSTAGQNGTGGEGGGGGSPTTQVSLTFGQTINNKVDILFVIDTGLHETTIQQKLLAQIPTFVQVLKSSPIALDLHVGVVSSDMGAHSDSQIMCTELGDDGAFQYQPKGTCTSTTLAAGALYLADDGNGTTNFTGPPDAVLQCIALLGTAGCGVAQPLAAADHALGADNVQAGTPTPPATNVGFLRPDASLAIIFLGNQDDASAPENTTVFSLNGYPENMTNPDGPLDAYRHNGGPRGPHLCNDPASANPTAFITEPLAVPSDAQGTATAPTLTLANCKDNDSGSSAFYLVSKFVSDIKALKPDPDEQILVAGFIAPTVPVEIGWYPPVGGMDLSPGELWPEEMHSCGNGGETSPEAQIATDGSFGDPGIRIAQFLNAFPNFVVASICDPSYAASMKTIATKITHLPGPPPCITGTIRTNAAGEPNCTGSAVVQGASDASQIQTYPTCADTQNVTPCFTLVNGTGTCVGSTVTVVDAPGAPSTSFTISCQICNPGVSVAGC